MNSFKYLLRRLAISLAVSGLLVALIAYGPLEVKQGATSALVAILAAVGTAVANHVKDDKTIKRKDVLIASLQENTK